MTDTGPSAGPPAGSVPGPPAPEAVRPPQPRRGRRLVVVAIIAAGTLVLVMGAALGYATMSRSESAQARLQGAIDNLEQADTTVAAADAVIQAELSPGLEASATNALGLLPAAVSRLRVADRLLDSAREDLPEDRRPLGDSLAAAIAARLEMTEQAELLLEANASAARALGAGTTAWDLMLEAERLSDRAVLMFNLHTKAGVTESRRKTVQAEARVRRALELFTDAERELPGAAMEKYAAYAKARLDLLGSSCRIDDLWLAGKIEESNRLVPGYNAAEGKVIATARALGGAPGKTVGDAYTEMTKDATSEYSAARKRATEADARAKAAELGD